MQKTLFLFLALWALGTTQTLAMEVPHDESACPDLTGIYMLPDPVFEPMKFTVGSFFEAGNPPLLTMRVEDEESQDEVLLDGIKKDVEQDEAIRAACFEQKVYLYEYKENVIDSTTTMELESDGNLLILIDSKDSPKIRQIGIRQ